MKRLEDHESFEMAVLQWLGSKRFLGSLVFGGGTMLRLCHELPRYSLVMDFWFFRETDFGQFYRRLSDTLSKEHDITDCQNKYHSILVEIRRAKGEPRLKIEIRKKLAPPGSSEEKIAFSPHFPTQVLVRGFTLNQMLENKVAALLDRKEIRDAFDLEFLVRKGVGLEDLGDREKRKLVKKLREFKKRDFDVKLGSILLPEFRDYYREKRFSYLEEKLSFQEWEGLEDRERMTDDR
jgi:predicted nucleotidyltransferase component of viral defense system